MAIVSQVVEEFGRDPQLKQVGIITLEDIIEELIQEEIEDERENDQSKGERRRMKE
jgi:CBS domain containing-hemolysin-like protein